MIRNLLILFGVVFVALHCVEIVTEPPQQEGSGKSTDLGIVLISTLDGRLRAINIDNGQKIWEMQEDPVVRAPNSITQGFTYLPNPQDGTLYSLKEGELRKLPFSIPQVVAASPCRGNDGVYYLGSKKDVWFAIDPETGKKVETLSAARSSSVCPVTHENAVFIGRREYRVSMLDLENRTRSWNTTFVDYSVHLQPEVSSYPLRHLVSSSTGDVLAIHEKSGTLVWQTDVKQPVVAMYLLRSNGLHRIPFTPVGRETMESIVEVRS